MARKRKPKAYDQVTEVRAIARERVGSPKPAKLIRSKKDRKKPKHKADLLAESPSGNS
jgi:hypothetical protein